MSDVPPSHPRYASLLTREKVVEGVERGITGLNGLIAQGRGEALDYLLGEKTTPPAEEAERAAAALLLLAERPVLSVNGNAAALVPEEMVLLARKIGAPLEVNIFYRTEERVRRIADHLRSFGAEEVLGEEPDASIPGLDHARAKATRGGIFDADVVFVPLEDGDRCEALVRMGKRVITVDLNPLSRTARTSTVTIVDNVVRALPNLITLVEEMASLREAELLSTISAYDNRAVLRRSVEAMISHLSRQFPDLVD
ncbi:MAG TPA: 4-phosphopantoate--beta-alanine ligase [Methanothrix sp.]|nr:phosphopantothenate/pantothenate synthetase [Methanothrix sp.]OPX80737.1 MAG: 4-phosphopantoate--beta-alanine ligase [Methanosaeta sp. PtaB.Bin087]OPY49365.1 MAG: 4-phosphopantoate--beta-alanine ligase [Methanosaeta sp. PtaU1.Bin055]HNR58775.1 4-phosphopantoate--beta-alanine ligase [Methanothrix sp.]HOI70445.1 4-phosphopantoate--beta-alanine ligase [Methanothrix sp.]